MKHIFIAFASLFLSVGAFAQLSDPNKIIKLGSEAHFIDELNLDHNKNYGFHAKDLQELFPALITEKRINEKFGKNAYRTKVVKVIDEKALIPAIVSSLKKQNINAQELKSKLVTL